MGLGSGVAGLLLERDKGLEARLLDGAVALDRDTGDDWVLGNGHGHATGGLAHADVGEEAGSEPVSYTHLDVYKRQPLGHARIDGRRHAAL